MYIYIYVCVCVCVRARAYTQTHANKYMHTNLQKFIINMHSSPLPELKLVCPVCMYVCMCAYTHTHTHIYIYIRTYLYHIFYTRTPTHIPQVHYLKYFSSKVVPDFR